MGIETRHDGERGVVSVGKFNANGEWIELAAIPDDIWSDMTDAEKEVRLDQIKADSLKKE